MIVPMQKVVLFCLAAERIDALEKVRRLGVLAVTVESLQDNADRVAVAAELTALDRLIGILSVVKPAQKSTLPPHTGAALHQEVAAAVAERERLGKRIEELEKRRDVLENWGDFDPAAVRKLAQGGVWVYLCELTREAYLERCAALSEQATVTVLSEVRGTVRFALLATTRLESEALPVVTLPEESLSSVRAAIAAADAEQKVVEARLEELAMALPELKKFRAIRESGLNFLVARDAMSEYDRIAVLSGYVPEPDVATLESAAREHGWGLSVTEPAADDENVPVQIKPPAWARVVTPLFDFLGISPGYREFDVSWGVLIFFAIFVSMIVNDAGYGLLMFGGAAVGWFYCRRNKKAAQSCQLLMLLSFCATVWGMLSGSYFGLEGSGLAFLAPGATQTANIELVCFSLALAHMSLGHLWRMVYCRNWRERIGQLGWVPILVVDFLIIYSLLIVPGSFGKFATAVWWMLGVGLAMVLYGDLDWKSLGAIFNFPFNLVGSFTDTLSYVRLFAVGISGSYMASSFNGMAMDVWNSSFWLIPVAILIMLVGHALNVTLALMGVLVHGVRLNTLEFSNHAGLRWSGQAYKPLCEYKEAN